MSKAKKSPVRPNDLKKSGTTRRLDLSMSSRIIAMHLADGYAVSLFELGLLVQDVAQCLDRQADFV